MKLDPSKIDLLSPKEKAVIIHKATERPFTGKYLKEKRPGIYYCKYCNAPLFSHEHKFDSQCGWPSFDDEIPNAIKKELDQDLIRTEILCANCGAHLGHLFQGEGYTKKQKRYCVNSISLSFKEKSEIYATAYFSAGCFWGVEYYMSKIKGVIRSYVGYMGGNTPNPTYQEVCTGETGHLETVKIVYDEKLVSYIDLLKVFFQLHDFTQIDGQGPDLGSQYLSAIYPQNEKEKNDAHKILAILSSMGYKPATKVLPISPFYMAEDYHQEYYDHKGGIPYCHRPKKIFD